MTFTVQSGSREWTVDEQGEILARHEVDPETGERTGKSHSDRIQKFDVAELVAAGAELCNVPFPCIGYWGKRGNYSSAFESDRKQWLKECRAMERAQ